jgi:hypothetical protein
MFTVTASKGRYTRLLLESNIEPSILNLGAGSHSDFREDHPGDPCARKGPQDKRIHRYASCSLSALLYLYV